MLHPLFFGNAVGLPIFNKKKRGPLTPIPGSVLEVQAFGGLLGCPADLVSRLSNGPHGASYGLSWGLLVIVYFTILHYVVLYSIMLFQIIS